MAEEEGFYQFWVSAFHRSDFLGRLGDDSLGFRPLMSVDLEHQKHPHREEDSRFFFLLSAISEMIGFFFLIGFDSGFFTVGRGEEDLVSVPQSPNCAVLVFCILNPLKLPKRLGVIEILHPMKKGPRSGLDVFVGDSPNGPFLLNIPLISGLGGEFCEGRAESPRKKMPGGEILVEGK